jgi:hypothetical protein
MPVSTNSETVNALAQSRSVLDELVSPLATASTRHRLRIIDRITDLFAAGSRNYSNEQIALFDDVLRRLWTDIEVKARAKLAERMAGMHSAPPKLVRSFAFDNAIEGGRTRACPFAAIERRRPRRKRNNEKPGSSFCDRSTVEVERSGHRRSGRSRQRARGP